MSVFASPCSRRLAAVAAVATAASALLASAAVASTSPVGAPYRAVPVAVVAPVLPAGQALAWGSNQYGQLGLGDTTNRLVPVAITGLTTAHAMTSDGATSYALKSDGTMVSWGNGQYGELGNNTVNNSLVPVPVLGLTSGRQISAGRQAALATRANHTAYGWGYNAIPLLGIHCPTPPATAVNPLPTELSLSSVVGVAVGTNNVYELRADGTVWGQGNSANGALGNTVYGSYCPVQIVGLPSAMTAVAAGLDTAYSLRSDGTVWAWGYSAQGELGNGTTLASAAPAEVPGLPRITAISAGGTTAYALATDGTVWSWGDNRKGAVGDGSLSPAPARRPVRVRGLSAVTQIAAGQSSGYALRSDGTVWSWGDNQFGQLGDGSIGGTAAPVRVTGLTNVVGIGAGSESTSAFAIEAG